MSNLDPRGGYASSSGDRSSDPDVPVPYAYGVPGEDEPDPYGQYRRPASLEDVETTGEHPVANGNGNPPYQTGPGWNDATAPQPLPAQPRPSQSQPAPEVAPEAAAQRGPGRRRAGRNGKPVGRAGRNLPAAIAVGTGLGLIVLASLFLYEPAFPVVIALAASVGIWEMVRALRTTGADAPLIPLLAGGLLITGLAWYDGPDSLILGLAVTILASMVWRIADGPAAFRRDLTASIMIAVYVPFLLGFGILLFESDDGQLRVLATVLAVVLSDTGGYAAGVFLGKHKMAPAISPGKTWEGFAGSVVAAALGSAIFLYFALDVPFYYGLVFGAVIAAVAVVGDLAESMLKRDLKIKDMSHLLPGHGGLMDRLDSILFAVPTAYLLLALIASSR